MNSNEISDEELRRDLADRKPGALSTLAARHQITLFDFAVRTSLDPNIARASVVAALERASEELEPNRRLRSEAWLLGLVRDEALERSRSRANGSGEEATAIAPGDGRFSVLPQSHPDASDRELAAWAWQAARSQRPRDYSLLDLSVRRGLTPDEVADSTAMSQSGIFAVLGRLRGSLEENFTATVLYFRGQSACADLAAILGGHTQLGPAVRRDIARHAENCPVCRNTRRSIASPSELMAAFEQILPEADLQDQVTGLEGATLPAAAVAATSEPGPPPEPAPSEPSVSEVVATGGLAASATIGAAIAAAEGGPALSQVVVPQVGDGAPARSDVTAEAPAQDLQGALGFEMAPVIPASAPVQTEASEALTAPSAESTTNIEEEVPETAEALLFVADDEEDRKEDEAGIAETAPTVAEVEGESPAGVEAVTVPDAVEVAEATSGETSTDELEAVAIEDAATIDEIAAGDVSSLQPDAAAVAAAAEPLTVDEPLADDTGAASQELDTEELAVELADEAENTEAAVVDVAGPADEHPGPESEMPVTEADVRDEYDDEYGTAAGVAGPANVASGDAESEAEPSPLSTSLDATAGATEVEAEPGDLTTDYVADGDYYRAVEADESGDDGSGHGAAPAEEELSEEEEAAGPPLLSAAGAGIAASAGVMRSTAASGVFGGATASEGGSLALGRDRAGGPPRRPWDGLATWMGENGGGRVLLIALLGGAALLAAYLGLAIGNSIEGGSSNNVPVGLAALPTGQPGVRTVPCGTGPITLEQNVPMALTFDSQGQILPGFSISEAAVTAITPGADARTLIASPVTGQPLTLSLKAGTLAVQPGRVDEYKVAVTFTKATDKAVSECRLQVKEPLVTLTPTTVATGVATTAAATSTPTPRPAATTAATAVPVFTVTPGPATAVPTSPPAATATPVRTATRTPTLVPTATRTPSSEPPNELPLP